MQSAAVTDEVETCLRYSRKSFFLFYFVPVSSAVVAFRMNTINLFVLPFLSN